MCGSIPTTSTSATNARLTSPTSSTIWSIGRTWRCVLRAPKRRFFVAMSEATKGLLAMVTGASIWGLSSIYYKALLAVPALEVIAHRTLWSMVFFGLLIAFQGRLLQVLGYFRNPRTFVTLLVSAAMISVNWTMFVLAIHNGWALDASLGYYIFPLMAVWGSGSARHLGYHCSWLPRFRYTVCSNGVLKLARWPRSFWKCFWWRPLLWCFWGGSTAMGVERSGTAWGCHCCSSGRGH